MFIETLNIVETVEKFMKSEFMASNVGGKVIEK